MTNADRALFDESAVLPVSVVIPCFRCSATIGRAIDSVIAQTARPQEILLIDDGSGDSTSIDLKSASAAHAPGWIRVICLERNQGVAVARNVGWDAARGELVAFLDADDAWHPNKLVTQYAFMMAHPDIALCGHAHRTIVSGDAPDCWNPASTGWKRMSRGKFLLSNRFITPSVMLRRNLPYRFRAERRHMEDALLWLEILLDGHPVARLDAELAIIFKRPWGEAGLSADLFAMERGELANCAHLARTERVSWPTAIALMIWSLGKFVRRLASAGLSWRRAGPRPT
ncbi:MAG: glycosyltransferase family 2 protein [Burkholderiales bacterium]